MQDVPLQNPNRMNWFGNEGAGFYPQSKSAVNAILEIYSSPSDVIYVGTFFLNLFLIQSHRSSYKSCNCASNKARNCQEYSTVANNGRSPKPHNN